MFVMFQNVVINLNNVHSFWMSNNLKGKDEEGFYIKISDSTGQMQHDEDVCCFSFSDEETRDKVFKEILFALQNEQKVLAVNIHKEEKK